jgi:hypothetical protein
MGGEVRNKTVLGTHFSVRLFCFFLAAMTLPVVNASAEIFQWTDSNGNIQFGDSPPSGVKTSEKKYRQDRTVIPASNDEGKAAEVKTVSAPRLRDAANIGVVLYVTDW